MSVGPIPGKNMVDLIRDVRAGTLKAADLPEGIRKRVVYFAKTLPQAAVSAPVAAVDYHRPQGHGPIRRTRSA
jgi:hypothetical protein